MKAKLIEYRWKIDTSADPYSRSGDGDKVVGGIFIQGDTCPDVLVVMRDEPVFRELPHEKPGKSLILRLNIGCNEWDFVEIGEIELPDYLVLNARRMAASADVAVRTTSAFREIFRKLSDGEDW